MKNPINIAVIVEGIDEEYQNSILQGIQDFASEKNVNLSYFISFGGIMKNYLHDMGEFNIYNLVNFNKFDGVILLTNTISSPQITQELTDRINKAGIPAACIDNDLSNFFYIGIDNFKAMENMVEHIITVHNAKCINYISGPDDNPESVLRLNAYKSVLEKHNIPVDEDRIYHGYFRGQDGRAAINSFLDSNLEFPEVIICANDAMALSAVIELERVGKKVPDDVIVTGFDNIYAARNYFPAITSVKRPLRLSGYRAVQKVYEAINGEDPERIDILDTECFYSDSCGCHLSTNDDDMVEFRKSIYTLVETYNIGMPIINRMCSELGECLTIEENTEVIKRFIDEIDCEKFVLCLCDDWLNDANSSDPYDYTKIGYTETMEVILDYENGRFKEKIPFKSSEMLPDLYKPSMKSNSYFFVPVHFRERCLGYCVMKNSTFPMESGLFQMWIMMINNSIENIRKIVCHDKLLSQLDKLSFIDPLCQIFNRHGFNKRASSIYNESVIDHKNIMVMFIDMDGLKYINDRFGHVDGDCALQQIAKAMKLACDRNQVYARYGGDEFIIFANNHTEKDAQELIDKIYYHIKKFNRMSDKPYAVDASIGYVITKADSEVSLNKVIAMADQTMYENKKRRKDERLAVGLESFIR